MARPNESVSEENTVREDKDTFIVISNPNRPERTGLRSCARRLDADIEESAGVSPYLGLREL